MKKIYAVAINMTILNIITCRHSKGLKYTAGKQTAENGSAELYRVQTG